jgi:hypothetical protein
MKRQINSQEAATPELETTMRVPPHPSLTALPSAIIRDEIVYRLADSPLARRCLASTSTTLKALVESFSVREEQDRPHALSYHKICTQAAREGNLGVLQQARRSRRPWSSETAEAAAAGGHLAILAWLLDNWCPYDIYKLARCAAEGDHFPALCWLEERGTTFARQILETAAAWGRWDVLQWLSARFAINEGDPPFCDNVEKHKELWRHGLLPSSWTPPKFLGHGCLEAIKWLATRFGCTRDQAIACVEQAACNGYTMRAAAGRGDLTPLEWLRQQRAPFNTNVTADAAQGGYIRVIEWLIERTCPVMHRK